jgi:DNA-binding transcriptional LysR family regulator
MAMNLRHLRVFVSVIEHGGFTRAAAKLGLSQPAISKSLSELERQLDVRLLNRTGRSATLTDAGRVLYARARELFGVERLAERDLREIRGLKRGRVRVAASAEIASYYLPQILGRLRRRRPGLAIQVIKCNSAVSARLIRESSVDVALVDTRIVSDGIDCRPWIEDEMVVIAPPDHPLSGQSLASPADLADWDLLLHEPGTPNREAVEGAFAAVDLRIRKSMRIGGTEAIKRGVAAGLGLGVVCQASVADEVRLGRVVILMVPGLAMRRTITRLRLRGRNGGISPAGRELELLLDEAASQDAASDATGVADRIDDHSPGGADADPVTR